MESSMMSQQMAVAANRFFKTYLAIALCGFLQPVRASGYKIKVDYALADQGVITAYGSCGFDGDTIMPVARIAFVNHIMGFFNDHIQHTESVWQ